MSNSLFNTPFEMALRILILLSSSGEKTLSITQLTCLDFICCYTEDFNLPFKNLHGINSCKFGELVNRRILVQEAIKFLAFKGMIDIIMNQGYFFRILPSGLEFVKCLESDYAREYREISQGVLSKYVNLPDENIMNVIQSIPIKK